jgi:hypothetical protein
MVTARELDVADLYVVVSSIIEIDPVCDLSPSSKVAPEGNVPVGSVNQGGSRWVHVDCAKPYGAVVIAGDVESVLGGGRCLEVPRIDVARPSILDIQGCLQIHGEHLNELGRVGDIRLGDLLSGVEELPSQATLSDVLSKAAWAGLRPSEALEVGDVVFDDLARNAIDLDVDVVRVETVPLDCEDLPTRLITGVGRDGVDLSNCLSFVALGVVIRASKHGIHMKSVAYTEPEVDIH